MGVSHLYGELQLEPANKTLAEIAEMTDQQILCIVAAACRRTKDLLEKDGSTTFSEGFEPEEHTHEEHFAQFASLGTLLGYSQQDVRQQWLDQGNPWLEQFDIPIRSATKIQEPVTFESQTVIDHADRRRKTQFKLDQADGSNQKTDGYIGQDK